MQKYSTLLLDCISKLHKTKELTILLRVSTSSEVPSFWVKLNMVHTHRRRRKGGVEGVRERRQREKKGGRGSGKRGEGGKGK